MRSCQKCNQKCIEVYDLWTCMKGRTVKNKPKNWALVPLLIRKEIMGWNWIRLIYWLLHRLRFTKSMGQSNMQQKLFCAGDMLYNAWNISEIVLVCDGTPRWNYQVASGGVGKATHIVSQFWVDLSNTCVSFFSSSFVINVALNKTNEKNRRNERKKKKD